MKNTLLLAVYKAGDKRSNLHIAFDQFQEQVTEMDGMKWRYSEISEYNNACENLFNVENGKPLFLSGEYEFLCVLYGLSGASGKWALIKNRSLTITSRKTLLPLVAHYKWRAFHSTS